MIFERKITIGRWFHLPIGDYKVQHIFSDRFPDRGIQELCKSVYYFDKYMDKLAVASDLNSKVEVDRFLYFRDKAIEIGRRTVGIQPNPLIFENSLEMDRLNGSINELTGQIFSELVMLRMIRKGCETL